MSEKDRTGLVQAYTGEGKGKTTAAIGLAVRASGAGLSVVILQFMKEGGPALSSEIEVLRERLGIQVRQYGRSFIYRPKPSKEEVQQRVAEGIADAVTVLQDGDCDVLILDELLVAASLGVVDQSQIIELLNTRPSSIELVLTGRGLSDEIAELCDLVTEMRPVKHPHQDGQAAREGIEY